MFLVDEEKKIIHDMSFVHYECQVKKIPKEHQKKIFSIQTVKRMVDMDAHPKYNGCKFCMSEYHTLDFKW